MFTPSGAVMSGCWRTWAAGRRLPVGVEEDRRCRRTDEKSLYERRADGERRSVAEVGGADAKAA